MLHTILASVWGFFKAAFTRFTRFGYKFGWWKTGIGILLLIIGVWFVVGLITGGKTAEVAVDQMRTVELRTVAELSSGSAPLSVAGNVSSKSEASVRAEIGGQITHAYTALGNYVSAGSILAEVENASQRASVAQAQGAVDAASIGTSVSVTTLASAKEGAVAALLSAYGSIDKSIHTDIDPMFANPDTASPQFNVQSSDSQAKINTENARSAVGILLARAKAKASSLSSADDLTTELATTQKELRQVRDLLDSVIRTLNSGIATGANTPATIAGYVATANAARSVITGAISALVSTQASLDTAQKSSSAGASQSSSQAALTQAQAGLAAARAGLEKTIVRAPISGTVNSFSLKVGDYLAAGTVAAVIANNGALEIVTYVTDTDAREIAVGNKAVIETSTGPVQAAVTRIAPAIDPATKKIEVRIGITAGAQNLVNGQSATVAITRNVRATSSTTDARITIPISALKVGADTTSIFTVDENNRLVLHTVELGTLLGDRVVITNGITADMRIVTDARGLQPGQEVIIK